MSHIYLKNGWWYYQWRERGRQRKKSMRTKSASEAKRIQKLWDGRLVQRKMGLAPKRARLVDILGDWLDSKRGRVETRTLEDYTYSVERLVAFFCDVKWVGNLTREAVENFVRARLKKVAPKTVENDVTILRGAIGRAYHSGRISEKPIARWPTVPKDPAKPETLGFYTAEEVSRLRAHLRPGWPFTDVFLAALFTGARRSELGRLKVQDVNLVEKILAIRTKKSEGSRRAGYRHIDIHPDIEDLLLKRTAGKKAGDLVFPEIESRGHCFTYQNMERLCRRAGVRYKRFHGLRHTFGTYLADAGASVPEIMQAMGHSSWEVSMRYVKAARRIRDKVLRLPF
jgi:integrase